MAISLFAYLALAIDRIADAGSSISHWQFGNEFSVNTFQRFALPIAWDFDEINFSSGFTGSYLNAIEWISLAVQHCQMNGFIRPESKIISASAISYKAEYPFDLILTDPPYYDAIAYSDVMDFFYIWLKRTITGINQEFDKVFGKALSPKWNPEQNDGELIDDASRFDGDSKLSKHIYENGMEAAFQTCYKNLNDNGILALVFAHKQPDAWETLVSGIIRAGFIVIGSWPIQTERATRTNAIATASLSSSVWLVCKKRAHTVRPGWDNQVLEEMRSNITTCLHDFWDAGIRGPDFVWAATGPALEAYSQYPVVKKANQPGEVLTVSEFLTQVRRMVVDFVVGRVLSSGGGEEVTGLDSISAYYLLHRHDFGMNDAPAGPCILYAVSCGLSDKDLADRYDLLARRGGKEQATEDTEVTEEESDEEAEGSGNVFRLKTWHQRKNPRMGYDPATDNLTEKLPLFPDMEREVLPAREIPLIDQVHRLMHLWKGGDVSKVNEYLDLRGLRRNPLFHQLLQALIELAHNEERTILESISNHVGGRPVTTQKLF